MVRGGPGLSPGDGTRLRRSQNLLRLLSAEHRYLYASPEAVGGRLYARTPMEMGPPVISLTGRPIPLNWTPLNRDVWRISGVDEPVEECTALLIRGPEEPPQAGLYVTDSPEFVGNRSTLHIPKRLAHLEP